MEQWLRNCAQRAVGLTNCDRDSMNKIHSHCYHGTEKVQCPIRFIEWMQYGKQRVKVPDRDESSATK